MRGEVDEGLSGAQGREDPQVLDRRFAEPPGPAGSVVFRGGQRHAICCGDAIVESVPSNGPVAMDIVYISESIACGVFAYGG